MKKEKSFVSNLLSAQSKKFVMMLCVALSMSVITGCSEDDEPKQNEPTTEQGEGEEASTEINGHEFVDLGLSVKWATCNVGATEPEGIGEYFAWGELTTKERFSGANSATLGKEVSDFSGNEEYDVARATWGGTWRVPTKAEIEELINDCTWNWETINEVNGYTVKGPNGNSIFLPAGGYKALTVSYFGANGSYWCSTPSDTNNAYYLCISTNNYRRDYTIRFYGQSIRPVSE